MSEYANQAAFDAATNDLTTIEWQGSQTSPVNGVASYSLSTGYVCNASNTCTYPDGDVTFTSIGGFGLGVLPVSDLGGDVPGSVLYGYGATSITASFSTGVTAVSEVVSSRDWPFGSATITLSSGDSETVSLPTFEYTQHTGLPGSIFLGFTSTVPIDSITLTDSGTGGPNPVIFALQYGSSGFVARDSLDSAPEPSLYGALLPGLGMLVAVRHKAPWMRRRAG